MTFDQGLQVQSRLHLVLVATTKLADFLSPRETSFPSSQRPRAQNERLAQNEIDHEFVGRKGPFTRREQWIVFPSKSPFTGSPRGFEAHLPNSGQRLSSRTVGRPPPVSPRRGFVEPTPASVSSAFCLVPAKS